MSLRDLIQIKASQTQGFPSFSAGISLSCKLWPWDTDLSSLALALFSPRQGEDQDCLKRMGNPCMGQHSWKNRQVFGEEHDMYSQTYKAAHSAAKAVWAVGSLYFSFWPKLEEWKCLGVGSLGEQKDSVAPLSKHHTTHIFQAPRSPWGCGHAATATSPGHICNPRVTANTLEQRNETAQAQ